MSETLPDSELRDFFLVVVCPLLEFVLFLPFSVATGSSVKSSDSDDWLSGIIECTM